MALEFTNHEPRWGRFIRVSEYVHARKWLRFQSLRGLAADWKGFKTANTRKYLNNNCPQRTYCPSSILLLFRPLCFWPEAKCPALFLSARGGPGRPLLPKSPQIPDPEPSRLLGTSTIVRLLAP